MPRMSRHVRTVFFAASVGAALGGCDDKPKVPVAIPTGMQTECRDGQQQNCGATAAGQSHGSGFVGFFVGFFGGNKGIVPASAPSSPAGSPGIGGGAPAAVGHAGPSGATSLGTGGMGTTAAAHASAAGS